MILHDRTLRRMLGAGLLIEVPDYDLVNPASIDLRIGHAAKVEAPDGFRDLDLRPWSERNPYPVPPGQFLLVETIETLRIPLDCAAELKLKSSRAREGWNHALAFWFDPGWVGIGTMELKNWTTYQTLYVWPGLRFGQLIVHRLDGQAQPYRGRYQHATGVEEARPCRS